MMPDEFQAEVLRLLKEIAANTAQPDAASNPYGEGSRMHSEQFRDRTKDDPKPLGKVTR